MQFGLSHLSEKRAWRIVSEDSGDRRPFLLIVRTPRIVTAADAASTGGFSEFPAYGQVYLRNYNIWSWEYSAFEVAFTSIVTAAVYRGFDQELRLAADPIN